MDRFLKP